MGILDNLRYVRDIQFCSGLVDLVVCVGHHGGGGQGMRAF